MIALWIILGFVLGFVAAWFVYSKVEDIPTIGVLREDNSDADGPYLFLEVDPGGLEKLKTSTMVKLKVSLESYLHLAK